MHAKITPTSSHEFISIPLFGPIYCPEGSRLSFATSDRWSINFGFLFKLSPINQVIRWVNFWKGIKWCWFVTFLCASDDTVIVHISSVATYSTIYHSINFMRMITNQRIRTRFLQKSDNNHYQDPDHENKRRECGASIFVDLSTCKIHLYLVTGTGTSLMSTLASSFFASAGS